MLGTEETPAVSEPKTRPGQEVYDEREQYLAVTEYLLELDHRSELFLEPPDDVKEWFSNN